MRNANAAMGTLLALFHSELSSWFEEDVSAALPQHDRGRKDYDFRYQPNKQVGQSGGNP